MAEKQIKNNVEKAPSTTGCPAQQAEEENRKEGWMCMDLGSPVPDPGIRSRRPILTVHEREKHKEEEKGKNKEEEKGKQEGDFQGSIPVPLIPIERKPKLQRTPPRERAGSVGSGLDAFLRTSASLTTLHLKRKREDGVEVDRRHFEEVLGLAAELDRLIEKNTHKSIKALRDRLKFACGRMAESAKDVVCEEAKRTRELAPGKETMLIEPEKETAEKETVLPASGKNLPEEISAMLTEEERNSAGRALAPATEKRSIGTQTETIRAIKQLAKAQDVRNMIRLEMSDLEILELTRLEWPPLAFQKTRTGRRSFLTYQGRRLALVDPEKESCRTLIEGLQQQLPAVRAAFEQKLQTGQMISVDVRQSLTIDGVSSVSGTINSQRLNMAIVRTEVEAITAIRKTMMATPDEPLAITAPGIMKPGMLRKIAECLVAGSSNAVDVFETGPRQQQAQSALPMERRRGAPTDTLMISTGEKSFAEVLKEMKEKVDVSGVDVVSIRKTTDGAKVVIRKQGEHARNLQQQILQKVSGVTAKIRTATATIQIRDLPPETTSDEVTEAVAKSADVPLSEVAVKTLRSGYGETITAIVTVPEAAASAVDGKRIRVAWISCRTRRLAPADKCFKCWLPGHVARSCKGPDRSKNCFNCGKQGHIRANCTGIAYCDVCRAEHPTGSRPCKLVPLTGNPRDPGPVKETAAVETGRRATLRVPGDDEAGEEDEADELEWKRVPMRRKPAAAGTGREKQQDPSRICSNCCEEGHLASTCEKQAHCSDCQAPQLWGPQGCKKSSLPEGGSEKKPYLPEAGPERKSYLSEEADEPTGEKVEEGSGESKADGRA